MIMKKIIMITMKHILMVTNDKEYAKNDGDDDGG